jgi:protein deglycase
MAKKALVVLAEGFEEIEAVTPIDILRRAGLEVIVAGLTGRLVKGSRAIIVQADKILDDVINDDFDALILPGGSMGAKHLAESDKVTSLIRNVMLKGKIIAAICAAPALVLYPKGILKGRSVTGFPGIGLESAKDVKYKTDRVVIDGNIITSRGAGTSMEFALAILEILTDAKTAKKVKEAVLA